MAITINKKLNEAYGFTASNGTVYYYGDLAAREAIKAGINLVSVSELPEASKDTTGKIYLVPSSRDGIVGNIKAEYVTVIGGTAEVPTYSWEKIGDTALDLSGYSKVNHTHKVTAAGTNSSSDVTFEAHTSDNALGEATTFTNSTSSVSFADHSKDEVLGSATTFTNAESAVSGTATAQTWSLKTGSVTIAGSNLASAVSFTGGTNDEVLGSATTFTNGTSEVSGTAAALGWTLKSGSGTATASNGAVTTSVNSEGIVSFGLTQPTITVNSVVVTGENAASAVSGTAAAQDITVGVNDKVTAVTGIGTGTAAAQTWAQGTSSVSITGENAASAVSGTAAAQDITVGTNDKFDVLTALGAATAAALTITVGTNDKIAALTALGKATAAAQVFTGSEVTTGVDIAPQA